MVVLVPFVETSTVSKDLEEYDFIDLAERLRDKLQKHWHGKTFGISVHIVPGKGVLLSSLCL